jgi:hypothetical protein
VTTARPRRRRGAVTWALPASVLAVVVVPAACSTSDPLTCPVPAAGACPSLDGVTAFCTWSEWGCAREPACDGYFVIVDQTTDARLTYYYSATSGEFVATIEEAFGGGGATCLAGPSQFQPLTGCEPDTLAECAPGPRDAGAIFADAAADAQVGAPSPSGSPSTQPFALPPLAPLAPRGVGVSFFRR